MRRLIATALAVGALLAICAQPAVADAGSVSVADAGAGSIKATIDVSSATCSSYGYCGWLGYGVERHAALPCLPDTAFLIGVIPLHEKSGSEHLEWTFRPFFPREERLCIYLEGGGGTASLVAEALVSLPAGYGRSASSGYNCSDFSNQRRAQFYLLLYPSDPSGLDGDNDGSACESNRCPCGAEAIPAEPAPPLPAPPVVTTGSGSVCPEGHRRLEQAWARVEDARRRFQRSRGKRGALRKHEALVRRVKEARQTEQQQIELCGSP